MTKAPVAPKAKRHRCAHCSYATAKKSDLVKHTRTHTGEKPFKCDQCNKAFAQKSAIESHKRVHTGEKPFKCDFEGCGYACATSSALERHKRVHTGEKPFKCDAEGCDYACADRRNLERHKRTHTGERPFKCDFEGCGKAFARLDDLKTHKRVHTGERPFKCDFEGCGYTCAHLYSLTVHKCVHTGEKPFKCDAEGCDYACAQLYSLTVHKRTHTGEKPYTCDAEGCGQAFTQLSNLHRHKKTWHTPEGMKRHKKQEERLRKVLTAKYAVDEQVYVKHRGCVEKPDGYCAFLDFYVAGITRCCVVVECDEYAHDGYALPCELSRMSQIHEALMLAGEMRPLVFVRYNPNGKLPVKKARKEREAELLAVLDKLDTGEINVENPFNLAYVCYPVEGDLPAICLDPDFDEALKATVVYC